MTFAGSSPQRALRRRNAPGAFKRACMTRILRGGFFALVVAFGVFAGLRAVWAAPARNYETTAVTVRIGSHTRTFSLAALQQMPKVTLPNVQLIGTD